MTTKPITTGKFNEWRRNVEGNFYCKIHITFEEFKKLWEDSGRWDERGMKLGSSILWFDHSLPDVYIKDCYITTKSNEHLNNLGNQHLYRAPDTKQKLARKSNIPVSESELFAYAKLRYSPWKSNLLKLGYTVEITRTEFAKKWVEGGIPRVTSRELGELTFLWDRENKVLTNDNVYVGPRVSTVEKSIKEPREKKPRVEKVKNKRYIISGPIRSGATPESTYTPKYILEDEKLTPSEIKELEEEKLYLSELGKLTAYEKKLSLMYRKWKLAQTSMGRDIQVTREEYVQLWKNDCLEDFIKECFVKIIADTNVITIKNLSIRSKHNNSILPKQVVLDREKLVNKIMSNELSEMPLVRVELTPLQEKIQLMSQYKLTERTHINLDTKSIRTIELNQDKSVKPIMTPYGAFPSLTAVARYYGLTIGAIQTRIKNHPDEYYYIIQEDYNELMTK